MLSTQTVNTGAAKWLQGLKNGLFTPGSGEKTHSNLIQHRINMSKTTKLQIMMGEALDYAPDSPKVTAAIDAMATWFEIVLEDMGIQPSAIPALLRWQYLHGQLMFPENNQD
jgi:hypothetical protein